MGGPGDIVFSGGLWLALPVALAAGLVSFLSPCVLPLVPGYLGYVSGVVGAEGEAAVAARRRSRMVAGAALFVAGFSVVLLSFFLLANTVGRALLQYERIVMIVGGVIVIALGLVFIGQFSFLQRTVKPIWRPRTGLVGAPLLGVVFAIGWTPCISPTLAAISTLAFVGDAGRALAIGIAYCIGLGVPFLLVALGFGWVGSSVTWVKRHIRGVNIVGGSLLVLIGLLMVTGVWGLVTSYLGMVTGGFANPL